MSEIKKPTPIRVKVLRFSSVIDIPFKGPTNTVSTNTDKRICYVCTYEPWLRHHRVTVSGDEGTRQVLVPESAVSSWEPLD